MVFRFKLVSDEVNNFSRTIEIDSEATFLTLRDAILSSVGYTNDQLNSFFICDEEWEKRVEVTLEDMGSLSDEDIYLMEDTPLDELLEDEGTKLIFVFDYLTERSFFMELKEIMPSKKLLSPLCTIKNGTPPPQFVSIEDFEAQNAATAAQVADIEDLDTDFYGDTDFNDDELPEGFDMPDE